MSEDISPRAGDTATAPMGSAALATVVITANRGYPLAVHRRPAIRRLLEAGFRVVLATARDPHSESLVELGCELYPMAFRRKGLSPLADLRAFWRLRRLYRRERPRLIHQLHGKPIILGCLAAAPGAKVLNTITGLGGAFTGGATLRRLAGLGYRLALRRSSGTIFQNAQDRAFFVESGWLEESSPTWIFNDGVDTERFRPKEGRFRPEVASAEAADASGERGAPAVLMAARLLRSKGVEEFIEAARRVRVRFPRARFRLAGEKEPEHPDTVDLSVIDHAAEDGTVEFLGFCTELEKELQRASIFTLPSYYREGLPRVILEAAACGLPVVTTDSVGCRDGVRDGETGILVRPRDVDALTAAFLRLLEDEQLLRSMGQAGRRWMQESFDLEIMNRRRLEVYAELGVDAGAAG